MDVVLHALALLIGALMPVQVGINTSLRALLGDPLLAGLVNMVVGLVCVLLVLMLLRVPWPTAAAMASVPAWGWLGGAIGAAVVVVSLVAGPKLGAATLFVLVVAGQIAASMLLDHFGVLGYPVRPMSVLRIVGALMLIAGVVLIVKN
ncbi:MAG: EamA-like transporter family protein [Azospira oryzae]|nr:MAG: EamA-like transporter family protein [Azospira oryzae]PZP79471.1 MAG: EamA-like transporter family protein [Azospira oryzae]